jgi:hypothetical protein
MRLHSEEFHDLYYSPNIISAIKSRKMRWAGHVEIRREWRGAGRVLVGKPEGKRPLGRSGVDGSIILKEDTALLCPDLGARLVWVVKATPPPLYPREEPRYTSKGAGWASGPVIAKTKSLTPSRQARSQSLCRLRYPGPFLLLHRLKTSHSSRCVWRANAVCECYQDG